MSEQDSASLDDTLAATPGIDDTASGDTRGRSMVALARGALVGRYVILAKLGAGGMGVVYAAHDPELDRKVAVKLMRVDEANDASSLADGRARLLREAQALAQLAHPHVVVIHDVGEHDGGVYLAMELVEGQTLRTWLAARPRRWREILAVMRAAALGLVAAHDKGFLHRDVKPDNIMVGHDGRVRVMDFGLARTDRGSRVAGAGSDDQVEVDVTRAGSLLGTPAYMAPEQWLGHELAAAADQFALCVTMWEALFGERPFAGTNLAQLATNVLEGRLRPPPRGRRVPVWLRRACAKGLEVEPGNRWPSLEALVVELDRGQARARARVVLGSIATIVVLIAGAEGLRRSDHADRVAACDIAAAEVEQIWNDDARASVHDALLATRVEAGAVTAEKIMPWLDGYAEAWRASRREACVSATIEERLDVETRDKVLWCLDDRRLELAMLVEELARPDVSTLREAVYSAAALSPPAQCLEPRVLASMPALPPEQAREQAGEIRAQLARAAARRSGGEHDDELELVRSAIERGEALGYRPLIAAGRLLEGQLSVASGRAAEAETSLETAYVEAAKASAWDTAASAAIELEYVIGERLVRPAEGKTWARHAEVALSHGGDPLGLLEAIRLNNLALIHHAVGDDDESRRVHEQALALREAALGPEHPYVAASLTNLANLHTAKGEYALAKPLYERALAIQEKSLGTTHPDVANALGNLAGTHFHAGNYEQAESLYERALDIQEKSFGPDHPHLAQTVANLANLHFARGDYERAKAGFEHALAIQEKSLGVNHPNIGTVLNNLGRAYWKAGEHEKARAVLERARTVREQAFGLEHPNVATTLTNLAFVDIAVGEYDRAGVLLDRALAIREKAGPEHPHIAYTLNGLAALALARGRPGDAIVHAERAVRVREAAKVGPELLAASEFLLARALAEAPDDQGRDLDRALELARHARDGLRKGPPDELREVEDWLAARSAE